MATERKTVFLVDDDITSLAVGKKALSDMYNVFTLGSSAALFEMLESIQPDLILLDVNMPEVSGYETIEQIKSSEKTKEIPVIFLTAVEDDQEEDKGFSLGAFDYIIKPFSPPVLIKRIEVCLLLQEQQRELQGQKQELLFLNNDLSQQVEEKTRVVVELKNALLSTLANLVEYRDEVTGNHIERTQNYIKCLMSAMREKRIYEAEMAGWDEEIILQSCQLHDVGKISVKHDVLFKPGALTPEEFDEIKKHTTFGEEIIIHLKQKTTDSDFLEYARVFAISHHEKWDGSGYPKGLSGEEIPLLGRMMAVADVYDALVEARPYKEPLPHEEAMKIILAGKGSHFDPTLVDLFAVIHTEFEKIAIERADTPPAKR